MKGIKEIIQPFMLEPVLHALAALDAMPGVTVSQVIGWGRSRAADPGETVREGSHALARKTKLEIVVPDAIAEQVERAIAEAARTAQPGDSKIFVSEIASVTNIRTGERDQDSIAGK